MSVMTMMMVVVMAIVITMVVVVITREMTVSGIARLHAYRGQLVHTM